MNFFFEKYNTKFEKIADQIATWKHKRGGQIFQHVTCRIHVQHRK